MTISNFYPVELKERLTKAKEDYTLLSRMIVDHAVSTLELDKDYFKNAKNGLEDESFLKAWGQTKPVSREDKIRLRAIKRRQHKHYKKHNETYRELAGSKSEYLADSISSSLSISRISVLHMMLDEVVYTGSKRDTALAIFEEGLHMPLLIDWILISCDISESKLRNYLTALDDVGLIKITSSDPKGSATMTGACHVNAMRPLEAIFDDIKKLHNSNTKFLQTPKFNSNEGSVLTSLAAPLALTVLFLFSSLGLLSDVSASQPDGNIQIEPSSHLPLDIISGSESAMDSQSPVELSDVEKYLASDIEMLEHLKNHINSSNLLSLDPNSLPKLTNKPAIDKMIANLDMELDAARLIIEAEKKILLKLVPQPPKPLPKPTPQLTFSQIMQSHWIEANHL